MCVQVLLVIVPSVVILLPLVLHGILLLNVFLGIGVAVLAGTVVVLMRTRRRWVRWAGWAVQAALVANALAGLIGAPSIGAFAGLALAVAVVALLLTPSSVRWFDA